MPLYTKALTEEPDIELDAAMDGGRLTIVGWPGATVADMTGEYLKCG
ncbi:MAG: hypothetical protein ACYDA0_11215 [Candidatus Dormibacteraceae bacterium]